MSATAGDQQAVASKRRYNLKPRWTKGQSGNPAGRPKAPFDIAAMCREHTAEAVKTLVETMRLKSHKDRIPAALALLDRGWGKPKQQLEVSADADAIGLHLVAARALVAAFDDVAGPAPAQIEGQAEPSVSVLDAPKPVE